MGTAIESSIHSVTVFSRGALIQRRAEIGSWAEHRPDSVTISNLPLSVDDRSIRTRIEALNEQAPRVVDARISLDFPGDISSQRTAPPPELKEVLAREASLHADHAQLSAQSGRLRKLRIIPRAVDSSSGRPVASPHSPRAALIELSTRLQKEVDRKIRDVTREILETQRERMELESRLLSHGSATAPQLHELRKEVTVFLDGGSGGATLWIEYLVPAARWAPTYALRVDPETRDTELELRAVVAQDTGEDWSDVELSLSTADPVIFSSLPELRSVRIGPRKPAPPQIGWRPAPSSESLYDSYDEAARAYSIDEPPQWAPAIEEADSLDDERSYTDVYDEAVTQVTDSYGTMAADEATAVFSEEVRPTSKVASAPRRMKQRAQPVMAAPGAAPLVSRAAPPATPRKEAEAEAEPEPELDAFSPADEFLDYGSLSMKSVTEPRRGTLQRMSEGERYRESLACHRLSAEQAFDAVRGARQRAYQLESRSLPSGCTDQWPDRFDHAYRASSPATIHSDGRFRSLSVMRAKGTSMLLHVCVPRSNSDVFRVAKMKNPLAVPILPGPVDIYAAGDFVTTSELETTPKDGLLEVGLGIEQSIKVARNTRYGEDSSGLLGGSRALRHEIHIELDNQLGRSAQIEVRERVPAVPEAEEDIRVTIGTVLPPWETFEPFPEDPDMPPLVGGYRWVVDLQAKQRTELRAHYEIKISSKNEIVGGNRREN